MVCFLLKYQGEDRANNRCSSATSATLLPRRLLLPDPYVLKPDDEAWSVPIQIPVDTP
jgi:hypothetical protein